MKHKATIAIALCTIAAMPTLSQTIPYAEFVNADTTVCDVISLNIPVRCKVNGTEMFSLRYNCPSQGDKLDRNLTTFEKSSRSTSTTTAAPSGRRTTPKPSA